MLGYYSGDKNITIVISSPGRDTKAAFAVYNIFKGE
jgi:ATP-dependent protease ClpP protease subunit